MEATVIYVHNTHGEDKANGDLARKAHLKSPKNWEREDDNDNVDNHIDDAGHHVGEEFVSARSARNLLIPTVLQWSTAEEGVEDCSDGVSHR